MELNKDLIKAIKLAQEGREEGFNMIYAATYNYVYFRAKTIMKSDDEAWDLLQEIYIVAYKSISRLEKPENLYAWLGGIAYNLGMKAYRKRKEILLDEESEGIFEGLSSLDKDTQPELVVEEKQTGSIVKELIDQLPELQKAAVIAYYFDELSVKDIAKLFECSEGTIKSRLNYARQNLKQAVEEREKKDNIKLRAITIPTILYALRLLSEDLSVSAQAAQAAYNGVCSTIGIEATSLATVANEVNIATMVGSGAQAAGTISKTTGLLAKFATAGLGSKMAIIGTTVVVGVTSVVGGVIIRNSRDDKPVETVVATIEATPTPEAIKNEVAAPTVPPETDNPIILSEEENDFYNLIIKGLTDSVESGYSKGTPLTDEQKMGIAYQVLYSLCFLEGNKLGYAESMIPYIAEDFDFGGDQLISTTFEIPEEDIDLLLNTILGETVSEHRAFEGFMYEDGRYYLATGVYFVGLKDYLLEDKVISSGYRSGRKYDVLSFETTEKRAVQEGIREIGYAGGSDGLEVIQKSQYKIEFESVEPTKFGRYSLLSFHSDEITDATSLTDSQDTGMSTNAYDIMKGQLLEHVNQVRKDYTEYGYSEYFIYDWNANKVPVLIIRDVINNDVKTCFYRDYHYIDGQDTLESYGQSIYGSWDSTFYISDHGFIMVTEEITEESESHGAYLYNDLNGADTKTEELWWWFRNNITQTTGFLDMVSYKEKRAKVESLEQVKWYSAEDLSPFE